MNDSMKFRFAAAVLLAFVLATFVDHLAGVVTFIGDADRLNAFLNFKLDELRSFSSLGHVPSWNWLNLGGFNFGAAYWMYPGFNFDTLAYSILPESWFYYAAGVMAAALFFAAAYGAFVLLLDVCGHAPASVVGSCAYAYSSFALTRIAQGDSAFLTLVLAPWALFAVRRFGRDPGSLRPLAGLTAAMAAMLWFTFLQEVAYVFMLLGAYAVFRSCMLRKASPLGLFLAAAAVATLLAFPRIATVADDFSLFSRLRFIQGTNPIEILRMLSDGIFGRYPEEIALIGNRGFNIHEGLRIFSSPAATITVLVTLSLVPVRKGIGMVVLLVAAIVAILQGFVTEKDLEYGLLAYFVAYVVLHFGVRKASALAIDSRDLAELWFSVVIVGVVMVVILNPEAGELFHKLFFGVSFIHSRLTIAALLPFSIAVAVCLKSVLPAGDGQPFRAAGLPRVAGALAAAVVLAWIVDLGVEGVLLLRHWNPRNVHWMRINPPQVFHVLLTAVAVAGCIVLARRTSASRRIAEIAGLVLCAFVLVQTVQFGRMKLFGDQTRTGDLPFRSGNYFNPPRGGMQVPSREQVAALRECTQNEAYRSILLADAAKFPEQPAAHLSHLWGLRLMDGYPVLYASVAGLPWPVESISLRSLRFGQEAEIPWRLLADLNVKYAIRLDPDLYFGRTFSGAAKAGRPACADLVIENPVPVMPRQFFVEGVAPPGEGLPPVAGLTATLASPGWVRLSWWLRWTSATVYVETREVGKEAFVEATNVRMPEAASGVSLGGLVPGRAYDIRLRHENFDTGAVYVSPLLRVDVPENPRPVPTLTRASRTTDAGLAVEWQPTGDSGTLEVQTQAGILGEFKVLGTVPESAGRAVFGEAAAGDSIRVRLQKRDRPPYSLHSNTILVPGGTGHAGDLAERQLGGDLRKVSSVQGLQSRESFSADGSIDARYLADRMEFVFAPSARPRFLVVNETFHPRWRASSAQGAVEIVRANGSMIALRVAPGVERVELRFVPLIRQLWIWIFPLVGLALAGALARLLKRQRARSSKIP